MSLSEIEFLKKEEGYVRGYIDGYTADIDAVAATKRDASNFSSYGKEVDKIDLDAIVAAHDEQIVHLTKLRSEQGRELSLIIRKLAELKKAQ